MIFPREYIKCAVVLTLVLLITACSKSTNPASAGAQQSSASSDAVNIAEDIPQNFKGTINNKLVIRMTLRRIGKELSGNYRYASQGINLALTGLVNENNDLVLNEFDNQGNQTGVFKGRFVSNSEITGTWSKPNGDKAQPFSVKNVGPVATTANLSTPAESPDEISEHDDAEPIPASI